MAGVDRMTIEEVVKDVSCVSTETCCARRSRPFARS